MRERFGEGAVKRSVTPCGTIINRLIIEATSPCEYFSPPINEGAKYESCSVGVYPRRSWSAYESSSVSLCYYSFEAVINRLDKDFTMIATTTGLEEELL